MSNTNDFVPFCSTDTGTNLLEQAAYLSDSQLAIGNQPGVARSVLVNKVLRQCSYVMSQIAQAISTKLAQDVLDNATPSALLAQIQNALVLPSGVILPFGAASAPAGWLNCDGSAVSRTTYANLFAAISTTYGAGDGSTTFNLPDARGVFLRGNGTSGKLSNANGTAFSGTLGSYQNDKLQGHAHSGVPVGPYIGQAGSGSPSVQTGGGGFSYVYPVVGDPSSDGVNGAPRYGTETNPANLCVNYIIRT
jgi:hypothetical protein